MSARSGNDCGTVRADGRSGAHGSVPTSGHPPVTSAGTKGRSGLGVPRLTRVVVRARGAQGRRPRRELAFRTAEAVERRRQYPDDLTDRDNRPQHLSFCSQLYRQPACVTHHPSRQSRHSRLTPDGGSRWPSWPPELGGGRGLWWNRSCKRLGLARRASDQGSCTDSVWNRYSSVQSRANCGCELTRSTLK